MSDDMMKGLQKRIDELSTENADLRAEAKDRRLKGKKLREELQSLQTSVKTLESDRDGWKTKAESSQPELTAKLEELQGKLRTNVHRSAFEKKAAEAKVRPDAVGDLWTLSGYQADTDTVDEAKLEQVFATAKASKPFLFEQEAAGTASATSTTPPVLTVKAPLQGAVGNGRGLADLGMQKFVVKKSDYGDAAFMMQNQGRIAEASKNGTLVMVD